MNTFYVEVIVRKRVIAAAMVIAADIRDAGVRMRADTAVPEGAMVRVRPFMDVPEGDFRSDLMVPGCDPEAEAHASEMALESAMLGETDTLVSGCGCGCEGDYTDHSMRLGERGFAG